MTRFQLWRAATVAAFAVVVATSNYALAEQGPAPAAIQIAQAGTESRDLEPRYQPAPPAEKSFYNDSYIFALTRGVAKSTMVPAAKVPLFVLTVPLDLVFLPIELIGGFFG